MSWYNPKKWLNLNTGIIVIGVIVALVFIGTIIIAIALWNVPLAKCLFPFLEISEVFPTKAIALFTAGATFGTLFLALTMIYTLKRNREENDRLRQDNKDEEDRDRRERLLKEIAEWAKEGIRLCALHKVRNKRGMTVLKYQRIAELVALHSRKDSISGVAKRLDKRLVTPVNKAIRALTGYLGPEKGTGILNLGGEFEGEEIVDVYPEVLKDFEKTFRKLLKIVSILKTELEI